MSRHATQMTSAQAIIACIKEGINKTFCLLSESYLPLLEGIYDTPEIGVI